MFLTNVEYDVLVEMKNRVSSLEIHKKIESKYGIHMGMNDPSIESLFKKYGVYDRTSLCQKADLEKVDVVDENEMPFYQYDTSFKTIK